MLTEQQNRLLTEVEGDAPMGRYMRERHWIPFTRSASLIADGAPQAVRLLGQAFVAFRATDGRIGFFDEKCPHRGASLLLARNEDCALRCIFHAWKFDVSGKVVEVPSEGPRSAAFAERMKLNHYPTFEAGGIVWVYLGKGAPPPKPPLPFMNLGEDQFWVSRSITPCNWLQGVEGTIDSIHVGTLHQSWIAGHYGDKKSIESGASIALTLDSHPRYEVEDTAYGIKAAALRELADGRQYIRVTEYVMPFVALVPGGTDRSGVVFIATPIDNHNHLLFWGFWNEDGPRAPSEQQMTVGTRDPNDWAQIRPGPDKTFGQNREAMAKGHFSGLDQCLLEEDMVVQASMGPIVDRTKENLCSSDVGLVHARRRLLEELAAFELGEPTPETSKVVRPLDLIAAADFAWRDYY
jgi:phthalate 4,5-dioxygenase oxygenase subunit